MVKHFQKTAASCDSMWQYRRGTNWTSWAREILKVQVIAQECQLVGNGKWQYVRVEPQHVSWAGVENIHPFSSHSALYNHTYTRCQTPIITAVLVRRLSLSWWMLRNIHTSLYCHVVVGFPLFHCRLLSSPLLCFSLCDLLPSLLCHPSSRSHAKVSGRVNLIMDRWVSARFLWHLPPPHFTSESQLPLTAPPRPHWLVLVALFLPMMIPWCCYEISRSLGILLTWLLFVFRICNFIVLLVAFLGSLLSFLDLFTFLQFHSFPQ